MNRPGKLVSVINKAKSLDSLNEQAMTVRVPKLIRRNS